MRALKQLLDERGVTQAKAAEVTKVSAPTVSRYLNGDAEPPIGFVAALAEYLNVSLDALTGNTAGLQAAKEVQMVEQLKGAYEKRLEDKREHIASQKARIERMEKAHAEEMERIQAAHEKEIERLDKAHGKEIERLEKSLQDHQRESENRRKRMDHKNKIILIQFVVMIAITVFALYWVVDSLNGDWGFVQYERLLELFPDGFSAPMTEFDANAADDFVGLWVN